MKRESTFFPGIFLLSFMLFLTSCEKTGYDDISIDFYNASGKTLNELTINGQALGTLADGRNSGIRRFDAFGTDSGLPDCQINAVVDGQSLVGISTFFWCCTEKAALKPGRYSIEIKLTPGTSYNEAGEPMTSDYLCLQFK